MSKMTWFKILTLLSISFVFMGECTTGVCQEQHYIVPHAIIDNKFDRSFITSRPHHQLSALIQNPNSQTIKDYILSIGPFSIPLFSMAIVTLIIFIVSLCQIICFNSCNKSCQCCGNQITSSTYNICCLRTLTALFIIISFFVVLTTITVIITNSDLSRAISYTKCNTQQFINETYQGNTNTTIPWSGINNFDGNISAFTMSIQNDIPLLVEYFSEDNFSGFIEEPSAYQNIIDNSTESLYFNAINYKNECNNSNINVHCPFPDTNTANPCQSGYDPTFNKHFCNETSPNSSLALITKQITQNTTKWWNSTKNLKELLQNALGNSSQMNQLSHQVAEFTSFAGEYQNPIQNGISYSETIINKIQIALYVFYSFICLMASLSIIALCMTYFCNVFKLRYTMYFFYFTFFLLSFLLFIISGFFLSTSVFSYDACSAYSYYFQNQNNFNSINFENKQLKQIFKECFFMNQTSMFAAFNHTEIINQFSSFYKNYNDAIPNPQFKTVVTDIQNNLSAYLAYPNTVSIQNSTGKLPPSQQPQEALNNLNNLTNSTSCSCKYYFTFDVTKCTHPVFSDTNNNNACVVLSSPNITSQTNAIVDILNHTCNEISIAVNTSITALLNYSKDIANIVVHLAPFVYEPNSSNPLHRYQQAYYTYYINLINFYNQPIQSTFSNFFIPYSSVQTGSSCAFITTSMNGIIDIACKKVVSYINLTSTLTIVCSVLVFLLFILSYFLTTRLEFYSFLDGDFDNYGQENYTKRNQTQMKQDHVNIIQLKSISRDQKLLQNTENVHQG